MGSNNTLAAAVVVFAVVVAAAVAEAVVAVLYNAVESPKTSINNKHSCHA